MSPQSKDRGDRFDEKASCQKGLSSVTMMAVATMTTVTAMARGIDWMNGIVDMKRVVMVDKQ